MTQIVPLPPRDYTSKQAFIKDLKANKDFQIMDVSSKWNGKPANLSSLIRLGETEIKIRYNQLRRQTIINLEDI